jgi:hypothetical protein
MSHEPRKPTGEIGPISFGPTSAEVSFSPIPFPSTKAEIERFIASPFVGNALHKKRFLFDTVYSLHQNPTDDFDFTLVTDRGTKYLELIELHLREVGDELTSGQFVYKPYDVAELAYEKVMAKSRRYRGATPNGIILLTYVTHWQFCLSNPVFWLLAFKMKQAPPIFEQVFHFSWQDSKTFEFFLLHPTERDFTDFNPEVYRDNRTTIFNPRGWQLLSEPVS